MKMEKPTPELISFYEHLTSAYPINPKTMFGMPCGFVNSQMQSGLFGQSMFIRLSESDRAEFLQQAGAELFQPMPGRAMKEYVVVPEALRQDPKALGTWMERSVAYAQSLPPKISKKG
jgi:TfoX/Sxy family transcriptional regulator of competence genes